MSNAVPFIIPYNPISETGSLIGIEAGIGDTISTGHGGYADSRVDSVRNLKTGEIISQSTVAARAGYVVSGIGGRPSYSFHGAQFYRSTSADVLAALQNGGAVTVFYVCNAGTSRDQQGTLFSAGNTGFPATRFRNWSYTNTSTGGYRYQVINNAGTADTDEVTASTDNNSHVFEWFHTSSTVSLVVDGVIRINGATNNPGTLTVDQWAIGALVLQSTVDFLTNSAQAAAWYVFSGTLDATTRSRIRFYLGNKYGISVT